MPKSDTWPGGVALETSGMDSAGSCDSVVSANSGSVSDINFLDRQMYLFLTKCLIISV